MHILKGGHVSTLWSTYFDEPKTQYHCITNHLEDFPQTSATLNESLREGVTA